jgi:drug/metabolite transporter (DMT)-like permease
MARLPIVYLVVACALWGFATALSKYLLGSFPPVTLLVLQLGPSAAVLWIIVLAGPACALHRRSLLPLVLLGLLNPGLSYTLSLFGLSLIPASVATLLWAAEPIMILALAGAILGEAMTARLLIVMLMGAFGVFLVVDAGHRATAHPAGILLMLGAVLCCAIYTVFSRKVGQTIAPLIIVAIQQTAGLLWAVSILPLELGQGLIRTLPLNLIPMAMVSGLFYYAAAYWLYVSALQTVPAAIAGSFFNLIPVFGVVFAFLLLGERFTPNQWAGAVTILASVLVLLRRSAQPKASMPVSWPE